MTNYDWENGHGEQWLAQLNAWEAMLKPIDEPMINWMAGHSDLARCDPPLRVVDMACGGGGTTFALEATLPDSATLHGFDISHALINSANAKAKTKGSRAIFQQANLQSVQPPANTYDVLISRFGSMFFSDAALAFKNMHKWLSPGGQCFFAVWGHPRQNPWTILVVEVARRFVDIPSVEPDTPGPYRYANLDLMLPLLRDAGFQSVHVEEWRGKLPLGGGMNAEATADFVLRSFEAGDILRAAGDSVFNEAKLAMTEAMRQYEVDGLVVMDAFAHFVSGSA